MKTFFALALIYCSILFSCTKNYDPIRKQNAATEGLAGTWKWVQTDGGIAANIHDTPASTGKNINFNFTSDGSYSIHINGILTSQGTYSITAGNCIHDNTSKQVLHFSVATDPDMMIESLSNNSLQTSDNNYDGTTSLYSRN